MKRFIIISVILLVLGSIATISIQRQQIKNLKSDNERLITNQDIYQDSIRNYIVRDSLNAVHVRTITMTLDEYKKYRAEDLNIIENLQGKLKYTQSVVNLHLETIKEFKNLPIEERIVVRDSLITDTLRCVSYADRFVVFDGCYGPDGFDGKIQNREELFIKNHWIPKRFLGFLWITGIKESDAEVVSMNPHTVITSAEIINIKK